MNYNLTSSQKNIWNLQKYYEDTTISTICGAILYEKRIETGIIQTALNIFIREQDALRLRLVVSDGKIRQYVSDYEKEEFDEAVFTTKEEYLHYVEKENKKPFCMNNDKMYRFVICRIADKTAVLAILNHIVSDAWTFGILAERVSELISNIENNIKIADKSASYITHIEREEEYFNSNRYKSDDEYRKNKYINKPDISYIKPNRSGSDSVFADRYINVTDNCLSEGIHRYCMEHKISPAVLFEAALITYLGQINDDNDMVTIGILVLNRTGRTERYIAGMFISTIPFSVKYDSGITVRELMAIIAKKHSEIFRHQRYPHKNILDYIRERHSIQGNIYDVMVSFQNSEVKSDIPFHTEWYGNGYSEVAIALHIDDRDINGSYRITMDYQNSVFEDKKEIGLLYKRLMNIISRMIDNDSVQLEDISIIPEDEYHRLMIDFNDTKVEYDRDKCVHELFMEQAERTPEKIALIFEDKEFTYKQIDEMSNSLAHILCEKGVGRGDVVPIILVRSWHIIVAMMGILKAGAAFVSITSDYPKDRINHIIKNAKCRCSLYYKSNNIVNQIDDIVFIDMEKIIYTNAIYALDTVGNINDLCYVIYTSGSTGLPKGLCISHANIINFCNDNSFNIRNKIINKNDDCFLSITNNIFDMFMTELFIPLTSGMTLLLANNGEMISGKRLNALCKKNNPDIIETTPTKLELLLNDNSD